MGTIWKVVTRKKVFDSDAIQNTQLARILNTFDLTALGIGSTLGVGVYVIVGHVARDTAGPSVVLSFLIAAIASVFAGLCYAEFGARTPRAGSAYIYSYTCIGEFVAFVIGWNLILEYVIGSASVAKGLSVYIDTLANDTLKNTFLDVAPINVQYMAEYFDFFSFAMAILLAVGLAFGMKESSLLNNLFTSINIFVVLFVVIAGSINADANNWSLAADADSGAGEGGFFPFGVTGMIKGAATCFYAFIGFDAIATTGEEVKNAQRAIPIAILVSLLVCFLCYFSSATVVTMMVPFYAQDINAPLPHAFAEVGWVWAKWVVGIGGIFGLVASLFGAMFPLPRILYAMASDGLIFKFLGIISNRFSAPVIGTLLAGLLTGLMSALFDLSQLVNMMSIGTLLAYTMVAACVLLLRFEASEEVEYSLLITLDRGEKKLYTDSPRFESRYNDATQTPTKSPKGNPGVLKHIFGCGNQKRPTKLTERLAAIYVTLYALLALVFGLFFLFMYTDLAEGQLYAIVLTSIVGFLMIAILLLLNMQPTTTRKLAFKVPLVPFLPALSILINIYLMLMLDSQTWIRFGVWMLVGVPMYIFLRLCCRNKKSHEITSEKDEKIIVNGNVASNNGHIVTQATPVRENGYRNELPSAPIDENSDSGFGSTTVLNADTNSVGEEAGVVLRPKRSLSNSVDAVISELDSVILHQESLEKAAIDRVAEDAVSIGSISNGSFLPVEEKVVALVHREDDDGKESVPLVAVKEEEKTIDEDISEKQNDDNKEELSEAPPLPTPPKPPPPPPPDGNQNAKIEEKEVEAPQQPEEIPNKDSKNETPTDESSTENPVPPLIEDKTPTLIITYPNYNSDDSQPVSLEDLHNERNESDTDMIADTPPVAIIPTAPSMENYEKFKSVQIPRPNIQTQTSIIGESKLIKIRPRPSVQGPPSRENSIEEEVDDDHVVFGTDRHKLFKSKLEVIIGRNNPVQNKLTKPEQHEIELPKQSDTLKPKMSKVIGEIVRHSAQDNEPDDKQDKRETNEVNEDFRGKLANIIGKSAIKPIIKPRTHIKVNTSTNDGDTPKREEILKNGNTNATGNNDRNLHRNKMHATLNSIKLRKVESFKDK